MRFFKSIRARLTIWYLMVIIILLLVFSAVAYLMLSYNLYQNLDTSLETRANELKTTAVFAGQPNELLLTFDSNGVLKQEFGALIDSASITELVGQALSGQNRFLTTVTNDKQRVRLYATSLRLPFLIR